MLLLKFFTLKQQVLDCPTRWIRKKLLRQTWSLIRPTAGDISGYYGLIGLNSTMISLPRQTILPFGVATVIDLAGYWLDRV